MEKEVRNLLASTTLAVRRLLEEEFARQIEGTFDIFPDGRISEAPSSILTAEQQFVRAKIVASIMHQRERGAPAAESVAAFTRECAFTFVNRLAALKMMEARALVQECVSRGSESTGFKEFCGLAPGLAALPDNGYRLYLECLFDEVGREVGVLFNRSDSASLLWPARRAFEDVLGRLNDPSLAAVWAEDETIGWIYQYYNDPEERAVMRDPKRGGSSAPRNSRELAVRNQFFTPRYVVEFLTDNTLGRLWYEMTRGKTALSDRCRYLVRRPTEVFLNPGESAPASGAGSEAEAGEILSQEELRRQAVHIPHRPLKDPREIRLLDPACGSMHFGLYAFDLFAVIYDEAWEMAHASGAPVKITETFAPFVTFAATFPDKAAFLREVPRLIVEHNIHGIDIDPRAAQIAGLSLWLRAQRAWHQAGVKPSDRPRITRSNLVCAEPMPGEKELLREFVEQQFPAGERPAFAFLLETIFDRMTLAGEAGSLLRIEEEIRTAIADAKRLWKQGPMVEQTSLFAEPGEKASQREMRLDLSGITDEQFWERAEQRIYDALEAYAEQAENGGGFQRRLFADDTAQGFAFIDLCRKRYDVSVMNPPFGEGTAAAKEYLTTTYPISKSDLFAAFIEESFRRCTTDGLLGAITSRTGFFLSSLERWRELILEKCSKVTAMIDLGGGVLDTAAVETAAYVLSRATNDYSLCINLDDVSVSEKEATLRTRLASQHDASVYLIAATDIHSLPGYRFIYWIPRRLRQIFSGFPNLKASGFQACVGLQTNDDFRFVRASWEVPREEIQAGRIWATFYKGGEYSPCFDDIHLVVDWEKQGRRVKEHTISLGNSPSRHVVNEHFYFNSGLAYVNISSIGFSCQPMPEGTVFSIQGQYLGPQEVRKLFDLFSSRTVAALLDVINPGRHYQAGQVQLLPTPSSSLSNLATGYAEKITAIKRRQALICEDCRSFVSLVHQQNGIGLDALASALWSELCEARSNIEAAFRSLDEAAFEAYQLDANSIDFVNAATANAKEHDGTFRITSLADIRGRESCGPWVAERVVSYLAGCLFGRWDIRYATGERPAPELPDPFAPLPVCPPGMLQGDDGLPLSPEVGRRLRAEGRYPLDVAWDGILVDDPEHPLDLERRVHAAIAVLWGDRADALGQEACALLGVPTLREWFRRPAGFFADHLKRYSKSRRQAPIYWPLSSPNGLYTVWLYYHRLIPDTFFAIQREFVKPKLEDEERHLFNLKQAAGPSPNPTQAREIGAAAELVEDLRAFRDDVQRIAALWRPNLNDGVIINHAPLWRLAPHAPWRKSLKETWDALAAGDYDWAHLALHLWPERVIPKCASDRSLAIAHDLETFFWVKERKTDKWSSKKRTESEIKVLVAERSAPAVKAALESLRDAPAPSAGTVKRGRKTRER